MLFGVVFGRLICGFLCPFGFIQDLLHKIPFLKISVHKKIDKPLRLVKYIIAIVMVILLPMLLTNKYGIAPPYFCKWICPAGTLEGGIPLILTNESLRASLNKCKMQVDVINNINSTECIRCGECKKSCPSKAIK